jgi:hypothetical protein
VLLGDLHDLVDAERLPGRTTPASRHPTIAGLVLTGMPEWLPRVLGHSEEGSPEPIGAAALRVGSSWACRTKACRSTTSSTA